MPKNREALIRYRVINRLLVNRKYASMDEMASACEEALDKAPISERTLRQDLFDMKNNRQLGYFAPIRYDYAERAYYYTDSSYSIDRLPLTDEEIDALAFAGKMLEQFRSSEPFDQIEGAVEKIIQHLQIRKEIGTGYRNFIDFEKAPVTGGSEFLGVLISAMKRKKAIEMTYQSFEKDHPSTFILHPYLLKEYRNRWYVFGYNEDYKEPRTYALDRIRKIETAPLKTFIEPEVPPKEYFKNIIGITRVKGGRPGKVVLKFSRHQANYILSQPLHESQHIVEETEKHVIISLMIEESPDLSRLLLGWGDEVEVLEPVSLREELWKIHRESLETDD